MFHKPYRGLKRVAKNGIRVLMIPIIIGIYAAGSLLHTAARGINRIAALKRAERDGVIVDTVKIAGTPKQIEFALDMCLEEAERAKKYEGAFRREESDIVDVAIRVAERLQK